MGGNAGPSHGPPHPKGQPRGRGSCPPRPLKSARTLEGKRLHRAGVRELAQTGGRSRGDGDLRVPGLGAPGNPGRLPRAPPGGGAGGAEAQSRRFPAEGQQQLRSAAGEGGTRPLPTAKAPAPTREGGRPLLRPPPTPRRVRGGEKGEGVSRRAAPASVPRDAPAPPPRPPPRLGRLGAGHSPQAAQAGTARPSPRPLRASSPPGKGPNGAWCERPRPQAAPRAVAAARAANIRGRAPGTTSRPVLPLPPARPAPTPASASRDVAAPRTRRRRRHGSSAAVVAAVTRGIPPLGQVVPRDSRSSASAPRGWGSGPRLGATPGWPCTSEQPLGSGSLSWRSARTCGLGPCPGIPRAP